MTLPRVGIAGTGRMGSAAAVRLAGLGFPVAVANRTARTAAETAEQAGCQHVPTFEQLAATSDVILVLTAGEDAVRETVTGTGGILAGATPGTTLLLMSTVTPQLVIELSALAGQAALELVDVPISGRPVELSKGEVTLFVGGRSSTGAPAERVLDALGTTVDVGPLGAAAAMKLGVNIAVFGLVAAVAECLALTSASGVDPSLAYGVLQQSAVASTFLDLRRQGFTSPTPPAPQFTMSSSEDTLQLIVQAAQAAGVTLPQTITNLDTVRRAAASGREAQDVTRLGWFLTEQSRTSTTD
jgi:3-hydroxyisobutyrate dehydrogenase-like beta-hydroxyacid dehydrogenase